MISGIKIVGLISMRHNAHFLVLIHILSEITSAASDLDDPTGIVNEPK